MICKICGIEMNGAGLDNLSPVSGYPVCEECAAHLDADDWRLIRIRLLEDEEDELCAPDMPIPCRFNEEDFL